MTGNARTVAAMAGALLYAVVGLRLFSNAAGSLVALASSYSAGLGAVSVGLTDVFALYALLALASVVANRMLSGWARGSERSVTRLYQAHLVSIVVAFLMVIAGPAAVALQVNAAMWLVELSGVAWGVTFVLTALLLGLYAQRTSSGSR
jgi:hypothetical protein